VVKIGAAMLGNANHLPAAAALRDIDEKAVAGFLRQKAEAHYLAD
jgi:hypothetical protein